jgi:DNA-binding PadR family transcriptional regulator
MSLPLIGRKRHKATIEIMKRALQGESVYGYDVARELDILGGTVQAALAELEAEGLLVSWMDNVNPHEGGRRPRRYYSLRVRS